MRARVRQFYAAVTARIAPEDRAFVAAHLTSSEAALFWRMGVPEQRHALSVARTALCLAKDASVRRALLLRCALLHDVGKERGDLPVWLKVLTVLLDGGAPRFARRWAQAYGCGPLARVRRGLYVYYHHAARGREALRALGLDEIAEIVGRHHEAPAKDDPPELRILREADARN